MLSNSEFNREVIRRISFALGEMNERVIFVGGATIGLYINDPAAEDVRATKDVDITVEIASKFAAHSGRGGKDPRTSHDFEDIVYVIDNRIDIVEQIDQAPNDVKPYLKEQLDLILNDSVMQEAILGNLSYDTREIRYHRIIQCIKQIVTQD